MLFEYYATYKPQQKISMKIFKTGFENFLKLYDFFYFLLKILSHIFSLFRGTVRVLRTELVSRVGVNIYG